MSAAGGGGRARIYWPTELKDNFYIYKKKKEIEPVVARIETICRRAKHDDEDVRSGSGYGCCLGVPAPVVSKIKTTISRRRTKLDDDVVQDARCCCLGLLDPAANIHVNSVIFEDDVAAAAAAPPPGRNNSIRLNRVIFDGDDSVSVSMVRAQRSLDGLVAFLTCLFPYLPDAEATAYLDAADMDPLAAALLIIGRRGWTRRFGYCSATIVAAVETALRCAAVAAGHPDPQLFVQGWRRVSRGLTELVSHLSGPRPDYDAMNRAVARLLVRMPQPDDLELEQPWELARRRLAAAVPVVGRELPPVRGAMKRMLLATIHGFYLKALGSLPKDELAQRLHRSLLHGGYCYGPLHPVANIVVNTVWHEATFPTSKPFEVAMISTSSLWRVAARSMYGLVSFLCTRYPDLTQDLALQRLLAAGGSLRAADPHLFDHTPPPTTTIRDGDEQELDWSDCPQVGSGSAAAHITEVGTPAATVQEAYAVAAIAAFHGCIVPLTPEITRSMAASDGFCLEDYRHVFSKEQSDLLSLHTKLLGSPDSVKKLRIAMEALRLHEGRPISKEQFDSLCVQVSRCSSSSDGTSLRRREPEPEEVGRGVFSRWSRQVHGFWGQHDRVSSMVAAALEKFNRTEECQYKVHVICGVNEHVVGPEMCSSDADRGYSANNYPFKFLHSHINFLATRLGKELGDDENHPKLFFAECNNDDYQESWCAPVSWSHPQAGQAARCYFCETRQSRIIHPALPCFHGSDFEEANFGSHAQFYYNDWLIKVEASFVDSVYHLEDDAIYLNYRVCDDDSD